jgi:hypothetical protein
MRGGDGAQVFAAVSPMAPDEVVQVAGSGSSNGTFRFAPLSGSRIVLGDSTPYSRDASMSMPCDLRYVDLAAPGTATTLVKGADCMAWSQGLFPAGNFVVGPDHQHIVYAINTGGAADGLYVVSAP